MLLVLLACSIVAHGQNHLRKRHSGAVHPSTAHIVTHEKGANHTELNEMMQHRHKKSQAAMDHFRDRASELLSRDAGLTREKEQVHPEHGHKPQMDLENMQTDQKDSEHARKMQVAPEHGHKMHVDSEHAHTAQSGLEHLHKTDADSEHVHKAKKRADLDYADKMQLDSDEVYRTQDSDRAHKTHRGSDRVHPDHTSDHGHKEASPEQARPAHDDSEHIHSVHMDVNHGHRGHAHHQRADFRPRIEDFDLDSDLEPLRTTNHVHATVAPATVVHHHKEPGTVTEGRSWQSHVLRHGVCLIAGAMLGTSYRKGSWPWHFYTLNAKGVSIAL